MVSRRGALVTTGRRCGIAEWDPHDRTVGCGCAASAAPACENWRVRGRAASLLVGSILAVAAAGTAAAQAPTPPPAPAQPPQTAAPPRLKTAIDLSLALGSDQSALAMEDWPAPQLTDADREALRRAGDLARRGEPARVLAALDPVIERRPESVEARWLSAQALEALGRYDHAASELEVLLQLRPSHAQAWRRLGMILATHGGSLEAERADQALQRALALEPAWDDLRALRKKVAEKQAPRSKGSKAPPDPAPEPTLSAQDKLQQAQRFITLELPAQAEPLLIEALAESPAYPEAAAAIYALTGQVPDPTVRALWDDASKLLRLATLVQSSARDDRAALLVRPWIDRAVALGANEARFARAVLRAQTADPVGALADLTTYVASESKPPHLDFARSLRASLVPSAASAGAGGGQTPERQAELALAGNRAAEARRLLGGSCRPRLEPARLMALGRVHEYEDARTEAIECYRLALDALNVRGGGGVGVTRGPSRSALERLALAAAPAKLSVIEPLVPLLRTGRRAEVGAASWALARLAEARGDADEALQLTEEFLRRGGAGTEALVAPAQAARERLAVASGTAARLRQRKVAIATAGVAALALGLIVLAVVQRLRGSTVERALVTRPALFPELTRAVAEIRHDVLKHRASALGLAGGAEGGRSEELARALLEPIPTSRAVADVYRRLADAAAGVGAPLRPIRRDPVFGPLEATLERAEALVRRPNARAPEALAAIDVSLREEHEPGLAHLLTLGPRTTLDAARLSRWIAASEAEAAAAGGPRWTSPGLSLEEINLTAAIEESALGTIVANLLRNAAAAVAEQRDPHLVVRIEGETDVTGRRLIKVLVADSAPGGPTLAEIEERDGQRGLGIVRDLARRWGGHLVLRPEPAPLVKAIGVALPAAAPRADRESAA